VLSTLPLPVLARMTSDLPDALRAAADELNHVSIRAVNLGVRGPPPHPDAQWIYFPEHAFTYHRIGIPTALTPAMAPAGHHALVAEISFRPDADPGRDASLEDTIDGLLRAGLLASRDDVTHARVVDIPYAYVVFDQPRRRVLRELVGWYLAHGVVPMGRYGTWDYLAMEDSLVHGREVAAWIGRAAT
jgi:protoporphyrinogen oxidase